MRSDGCSSWRCGSKGCSHRRRRLPAAYPSKTPVPSAPTSRARTRRGATLPTCRWPRCGSRRRSTSRSRNTRSARARNSSARAPPVFGGARADEFLARALLVFLDLLVDLRLEPHRGQRQVGKVAPRRVRTRLVGALGTGVFDGYAAGSLLRLCEQPLLAHLQLLHPSLRIGKVLAGAPRLDHRQRGLRAAPLIDIAAAVEVRLSEHIG